MMTPMRIFWATAILAAIAARTSVAAQATPTPTFAAEAWPEADQLFRRDPHWVGGDGAYSIDLGRGRVLWMFGDSLIDPTGQHSRASSGMTMVGNSVAIQQGYNPAEATLTFAWRSDGAGGKPSAFFPDGDGFRYWPGHGVRIRDRLIVFLMKVRSVPAGLGFDVWDWDAVLIRNPDDPPEQWKLEMLDAPANDRKVIVGSASVLVAGDWAYAFSAQERSRHPAYLVRWPVGEFYEGRLDAGQWRLEDGRWGHPRGSDARPAVVLDDAATEFTVHQSPESNCFLQVQTTGFGAATINVRAATALTGPWSPTTVAYRPPEFDKPGVMIYQGKAHPHLAGADLVASYCTNHANLGAMLADANLYYPRLVKLTKK